MKYRNVSREAQRFWLLLTVLGGAFCLMSRRGPKFLEEPGGLLQFWNSSGAVVRCSAEGRPQPTVHWETSSGSSIKESKLIQTRSDGTLHFLAFPAEDYQPDVHSGSFRCVATNPSGSIKSTDVRVRAVVFKPYDAVVYDQHVMLGNAAKLECHVPTHVLDYIRVTSWIKNDGRRISPSNTDGDKYLILPREGLLIRNVTSRDSDDSYLCEIFNRLTGETKLSTKAGKLFVTDPHDSMPPTISSFRSSVHGSQGDMVTLPCVAQGKPPPQYHWYREHHGLRSFIRSGYLVLQTGIIVIQQARVEDSGTYVCVANNSLGAVESTTELFITAPLLLEVNPDFKMANIGETVEFTCIVNGHPIQSVTWLRNCRPLLYNSRITHLGTNVLRIAPVERGDRGMYQCVVANEKQVVQSAAELVLQEQAPTFLFTFNKKYVHPGSSLSLKCSASGNPLPQITWTRDGAALPEAYHIRVGDYVSGTNTVNSYINITTVSIEDGATYACIATNGAGQVYHSNRVDVYGPPFVRPLSNHTVLGGKPAVFHCPVSGYPLKEIIWKKANKRLPFNHRQKTFPNGTLVLQDIQKSVDGGLYSCEAIGEKGETARSSMVIYVATPPVVEPFNFNPDLTTGQRVTVVCVVSDGDLPITIRWLKDGISLPSSLHASINMANNYTSLLSFPVVRREHSGNYTCVASNPAASNNFTATMDVKVPPSWKTKPHSEDSVVNKKVILHCQADGSPPPVIRWKKSTGVADADFRVVISNANVQILENGSLLIREADVDDGGHYMCQATNGVNPDLSMVVELNIHVAVQTDQRFQTRSVRRGENVALQCRAKGDKPITVTWTNEMIPLIPRENPRYTIENKRLPDFISSTLQITSADRRDSGSFVCLVENPYGSDETRFRLIVQERPDAPLRFQVKNTYSRSVTLTWAPPFDGNNPITRYLLEYKEASKSWEKSTDVVSVVNSSNQYTVQGLSSLTMYSFRLRAQNTLGPGDFSEILNITTDSEPPEAIPEEVRFTPTSSRAIRVEWRAPDSKDSHRIMGYYVGYRRRGYEKTFSYKTVVATMETDYHCDINQLDRSTVYEVIVQAFNDQGSGPATNVKSVETLKHDPPDPPTLRVVTSTTTSVYLNWEPKESDNSIEYYLLYRSTEHNWEEIQSPGNKKSYIFHGLRCGTRYQFYIVAHNSAGKGTPSDIISAKTYGTAPQAPEKHSLLSVNTTFVVIHLTAWWSGGCPILHFVIQYKQSDSQEWVLFSNNILPDQKSISITDLLPATWYTLLMTATNEAGSTEAEYLWATLTSTGATLTPKSSPAASTKEFYRHLKIVIPVVCTTVVLVLVLTTTCLILIRRRHGVPSNRTYSPAPRVPETGKENDSVPMAVWDKPVSRIHNSQEQLYFPSPYATSRISMYSGDGDTEGRTTPCWPPPNLDDEDHTYDVPFRNKQNSTTNRRREQESDTSRYRSKERHLYINPGNVTMPVEKCIGNQGHAGNRNTTVDSSGGQLCMFLQSPTRVRLSEGSYDKIRRQEQSRMSFCEGKPLKILKQAQQQETGLTTGNRMNRNLAQQQLGQMDMCVDSWEISDTECDRHLTSGGVTR